MFERPAFAYAVTIFAIALRYARMGAPAILVRFRHTRLAMRATASMMASPLIAVHGPIPRSLYGTFSLHPRVVTR